MCYLRNDLSIQIEIQKYFHNFNYKNTNSVSISNLEKNDLKKYNNYYERWGLTDQTWRESGTMETGHQHKAPLQVT